MKETMQTIVIGMLPKDTPGYGNNDMIRRVYGIDGIAPTIRTFGGGNQEPKIMEDIYDKALNTVPKDCNIKIRKLTPRECWRLMGQKDEDFEKAEAVNSNCQLYKQAGNSIVVDVLEYILKPIVK